MRADSGAGAACARRRRHTKRTRRSLQKKRCVTHTPRRRRELQITRQITNTRHDIHTHQPTTNIPQTMLTECTAASKSMAQKMWPLRPCLLHATYLIKKASFDRFGRKRGVVPLLFILRVEPSLASAAADKPLREGAWTFGRTQRWPHPVASCPNRQYSLVDALPSAWCVHVPRNWTPRLTK